VELPILAQSRESAKHLVRGVLPRAWYQSPIRDFRAGGHVMVLGQLLRNTTREVLPSQRDAWQEQYHLLCPALEGYDGHIFWEFAIPRMGRRIDVVLLIHSTILVIEFKIGQSDYASDAVAQVWDYALDLKNFHESSHFLPIVPVLFCSAARPARLAELAPDHDGVYRPVLCGKGQLGECLNHILHSDAAVRQLDGESWMRGAYKPTPTILEAARALYTNHSVEEIARSDAGAQNLALTSSRIEALAKHAQEQGRKIVCFVTGVPGAGKTLVGLNVANKTRGPEDHAVFLSGNGPLVAVLREALTRDEYARRKAEGEKVRKGRVAEGVKAFIQNVHHFRDEALVDGESPPADHIAVFDEAQRAWDRRQTASFMQRKRKRTGFAFSEPEFLLHYMDRHQDWALVVCLVGGGQEINTGEAGIDAWLDAIETSFADWEMYISSRLTDSEYSSSRVAGIVARRANTFFDDALHLGVSMRSFRAENVASLVKTILDCDAEAARAEHERLLSRYPVRLTRDLQAAKRWLRQRARGSERFGLVCSSKATRLKPHAIDIRYNIDPVVWFLNDATDIRSSYYLEDVATEFHVQGLELDWVCVGWDGDLRWSDKGWCYHDFRGDRWQCVHAPDRQRYLKNAYRVLLTRARQGMVIFVPPGDPEDPTRLPEFYDPVFQYLKSVGLEELPA
jgi:hypothetical protein